ncbi:WYL domain-containing protein [Micromonospora sp. DT201]|uniref:WYL domain-containing protein n=1 Tax=Micromonospora sp. DT201 TaxID=3393442 RepID=UPI003CF15EEA
MDRAWQERSTQFRTGGEQVTVLVRVNPARREDLVGTALAIRAEEADADGWLRLEVIFQDPRHAEWALWQLATNAEALAPRGCAPPCTTAPPQSSPATETHPDRSRLPPSPAIVALPPTWRRKLQEGIDRRHALSLA